MQPSHSSRAQLPTILLMVSICYPVLSRAASVRQDPPEVTWSHSWNFDDGLQGWTITDGHPDDPYTPRWIDPAVEPTGPMLPDGSVSGGGAGNLYLPDGCTATLPLPGGPALAFVFQADVYVPNLYPITGFPGGLAGNFIHEAGIAVGRQGGTHPAYISGTTSQRYTFKAGDRSWDGTTQYMTGQAAVDNDPDAGTEHLEAWWDDTVTLRVDYKYSEPDYVSYYVRVPWAFPGTTDYDPGWYLIARRGANPDTEARWDTLSLGGTYSWTQAQFDNAHFVPEPGSFALTVLIAAAACLLGRSPRTCP